MTSSRKIGVSSEPLRPDIPLDSSALINQVCQENRALHETLSAVFELQSRLLRLPDVRTPEEASACLQSVLDGPIRLGAFELRTRSPESGRWSVTFRAELPGIGPPRDSAPAARRQGGALRVAQSELDAAVASGQGRLSALAAGQSRSGPEPAGWALIVPLREGGGPGPSAAVLGLGPGPEVRSGASADPGSRLAMLEYVSAELSALVSGWRLTPGRIDIAALSEEILDVHQDGFIALDAEGRIMYRNRATATVLRRHPSGPGEILEACILTDLKAPLREALDVLRGGAAIAERSVRATAIDGRVLHVALQGRPLRLGQADVVGFLLTFQDTSLDVEVEHLKRLDAMKSDFVLGLIHDMKTPLTGIVSGCELFMVGAAELEPEQLETLEIIQASARRLQNLATDLLRLFSMESANYDEPLAAAELDEIVRQAIEPFVLQSDSHRIHFAGTTPPISIRCQPRLIGRVVENLLGNAIKYSPNGGDIWVSLVREENMARIEVKDEGMGIKKSEVAMIWERFHRAPGQKVLGIEGTGLGLSIIKMIVDKHHGTVTVDSEFGRGSTFTVHLPISIAVPQPDEVR